MIQPITFSVRETYYGKDLSKCNIYSDYKHNKCICSIDVTYTVKDPWNRQLLRFLFGGFFPIMLITRTDK